MSADEPYPYSFGRYRLKQEDVQALQYTGHYDPAFDAFLAGIDHAFDPAQGIRIATLDAGVFVAKPMDWLIRDRDGKIDVMPAKEFAETYERVDR